ncbi:hypothetical protein Tco_1285295 [Tanacetum coccineum]
MDDPYMKVMTLHTMLKESPMPPTTIVLHLQCYLYSLMLKEFLSSGGIIVTKKQGINNILPSSSALPQEFEMGESSRKTSLEHHEEQIKEILNHLDELSLDRIHRRQNRRSRKRMPPKRMSTSEAPAMTQAAIRKLVADSVTAALEAQAANMANTDNTTRPREAPMARQCSYKEFMSCQPINFKGTKGAIGLIRWFERTESYVLPVAKRRAYKITGLNSETVDEKMLFPGTKV